MNNGLKPAKFIVVEEVLGEVVNSGLAHTVTKAEMSDLIQTMSVPISSSKLFCPTGISSSQLQKSLTS